MSEKTASPNQLKWLYDLLNDKDTSAWPEDWAKTADRLRELFAKCISDGYEANSLNTYIVSGNGDPLTHEDFQKLLPKLQAAPKAKSAIHDEQAALPDTVGQAKGNKLADGYYCHKSEYYRVVHNRAGTNQYAQIMVFLMDAETAKALAGTGQKGNVFKWEYRQGAIYKLNPAELVTNTDLTDAFGGLYSACCQCGALLNDPLSVKLNIGPVCGGRVFGEEFKGMLKKAKADLLEEQEIHRYDPDCAECVATER